MNESTTTPISSLLKSLTDTTNDISPNDNRDDSTETDEPVDIDIDDDSEDYIPPGENETKYLLKQGNGSKPLIQCFWNGTRWADAEHVLVGRKFFKKELIIISWNVCSKETNYENRIFELGKFVRAYDPDLIAFQEVNSDILKLLLNQKWLREYFVSDGEGRTLGEYGNVIFSKVKFFEINITPLESKTERKAIISTVLIKGLSPLAFGTFHLESNTEDMSYRASQMQSYMELTKDCPNVILVGDTSFTEHEKNQSLGNRFKDSWITLNHQSSNPSSGLTFDTFTNKMARNGSDLKQLRLDRCYYTHESIKPIEMNILQGEISNSSNEWVSYHYGIMVKFGLKS